MSICGFLPSRARYSPVVSGCNGRRKFFTCNDWHTAFAPLFLKAVYDWDRLFAGTRSVLTIHNIGYQGVFGSASVEDLGLGPKNYMLHQDDLRAGRINPAAPRNHLRRLDHDSESNTCA